MNNEHCTISIRRPPRWFWLLLPVWLPLEVLLLQTAWASMKEEELRASMITGIASVALVVVGLFAVVRRGKATRGTTSKEQETGTPSIPNLG